MKTPHAITRWLVGGIATAALLISAGAGSAAVRPQAGLHGTATFAQLPATTPNWIFPMEGLQYFSVANIDQFQYLMWRPLYWFGTNGQPTFNAQRSLAAAPRFSNGGRTATIVLKHYLWSDGRPVTTRDVRLWMDMLLATRKLWAAYVPGNFPDNIAHISYASATTFSITFNKVYSPYWLLYNELSQIIPVPQHAWDRTSVHGPVGNYDLTTRGATQVYTFLTAQSKLEASYTTNPLWKTVDGPWTLRSFDPSTGYAAFVPNSAYSGSPRPRLARFVELPFTTDTAEVNALRAGQVDYGYIPQQDVSQIGYFKSRGFQVVPWISWQVTYFPINFTNPVTGPIFHQLYIRQAMQHLIDQPGYIKAFWKGYAHPTYGPVPTEPSNPWASPYEKDNPYPFSISAASQLLSSHGWSVHPNGTTTCTSPGTGAGQCGAGIASGTPLTFSMQYVSGSVPYTQEMEAMRSAFSLVGITINVSSAPFNTVIGNAVPCNPKTGSGCKWDMEYWGAGWIYAPDYYPTGGEIFATGAGSNSGGYSDPINDANIAATHSQPGTGVMFKYENYLAQQLPVLWLPTGVSQISVINTHLHGTLPQDPLINIYPEDYTLSG